MIYRRFCSHVYYVLDFVGVFTILALLQFGLAVPLSQWFCAGGWRVNAFNCNVKNFTL